MEHVHCAKVTINSQFECTKHPHARTSFQQFMSYYCQPIDKIPGLPAEARGWDVWRWGESNPRPTADPEVFSGRILLLIS